MNPNDPSNFERQQELRRQQEALQLRQEEQRLELARRATTSNWIINSIYFFVGLLEILLGLRFLLRVLGANTDNTFAQVIYNLSDPFVAPFSTLFVSPVTGGGANIFDVNVLIAIVVYALLGWLAVWLVRLLQGRG
jgi:uncharacterized protein YggT (Ycf19 family)